MQLRIQGVLLFFVIVLFGFSRSLESIVFEQDHYNIEYNLKLRPLEVDSSQQIWLQPKKMAKSLLQLYLWWYTYTGLWLKNSLLAKIFNEPVIFFHERPETKFLFPAFCNALNAWLPSFVFIRWVDAGHGKRTCSNEDFISITCLSGTNRILKVVRNLFQTFHLVW